MKRCVLLVAVVLVGMLSAPLHAKDPDIVGTYKCTGVNPEGKPYTAIVAIRKHGAVFHLHWAFGEQGDNYGVGLIEGGKLSVAVFGVVTIATGLVHPWSIAFLPDGRTLLVVERAGRLRMIRDGVLWLVELKADRGRLTSDQRAWYEALMAVRHVRIGVWRPRDLPTIVETMR